MMDGHAKNSVIPSCSGDDANLVTDGATGMVEIGQWYWVKYSKGDWLGCVTQIGSNFVELTSPKIEGFGRRSTRVLFTDFQQELRLEPNAQEVIMGKVNDYQGQVNQLMGEVRAITARLGVYNGLSIEDRSASEGTAIVAMSGAPDIDGYKNALVVAKEKTLPDLFKKIKEANAHLAGWMSAETLPMLAMAEQMQDSIKSIDKRIFNVSLYAGLTEQVIQFADGEPAAFHEKLHVMQRRLYMDEECLLNYQAGGMEFKHIDEFDAWLAKPANRDRILPFPRCMVAMKVRRLKKDRSDADLDMFIKFRLEQCDKFTFLYIRNGDRLYCLATELEFDELIFPEKSSFDPGEPLMVKMVGSRVARIVTRREYDAMLEEDRRNIELHQKKIEGASKEEWIKNNPNKSWDYFINPWHVSRNIEHHDKWEPFDSTSVYFDEAMKVIEDQVAKYNRVALVIQGLFDRSEILHPHPPVKTWTPDGFAAAIELVYDGSMALHHGEAPDFEAYRKSCNASLNAESVVYGQERYWMEKEAEKENDRIQRDWRVSQSTKDRMMHKLYRPHMNDGPGVVAKMEAWKPRAQQAVFSWHRKRIGDGEWYSSARRGDPIRCTLTVPADRLFNISAYKPGDYLQFFQDSRTRAQYLKWAPMLLTAEDYWAGKIEAQEPVK